VIAALHLRDLALARGGRTLFSGLTVSVAAGEAVALVGANGAGKTSLLRAVAGFVRPSAGEIRFDGPADAEEARGRWLHLVGHAEGLKPGRTAWEELRFATLWTGGTEASVRAAVARFRLEPLLDLPTRKLSVGQKRRLALARLVAAPRPLWLLDEPLAPLDAERRAAVGEVMAEHLACGGLILAAVHDPLPIPARPIRVGAEA
jgi:heme exporter protein A